MITKYSFHQSERNAIISNKHGIYDLPHKLLNDIRLKIFGIQNLSGKSQNFIGLYRSAQPHQKSAKMQKLDFSPTAPIHIKTIVCLKYFVPDCCLPNVHRNANIYLVGFMQRHQYLALTPFYTLHLDGTSKLILIMGYILSHKKVSQQQLDKDKYHLVRESLRQMFQLIFKATSRLSPNLESFKLLFLSRR